MFYVITRYEGVEYTYTIHKARTAPKIELMGRHETAEGNGTKVVVPVNGGDKYKFITEIKRQLQYFDNINYEGCNVDNDYKIYRGTSFLYREDSTGSVHIALGKVYYPIDWEALGKDTIKDNTKFYSFDWQTPIALRFEIGELPVVWNRENIEYTDEAVELIKERLGEAINELQEIYDKKHSQITTLDEYLKAKRAEDKSKLEITDGVEIPNISYLIDNEVKYPKYEGLFDKIPKDIFFDYKVHRRIENGLVNAHKGFSSVKNLLTKGQNIYYCKEKYKTLTNKYIYHKLDVDKFYIIKKKADSDLAGGREIARIFNLGKTYSYDPTQEEVKAITDFRKEVDEWIENNILIYEDITVPDTFNKWLKDQAPVTNGKTTKAYDPNTEVPYKPVVYDNDGYYSNRKEDYKFTMDHIKYSKLNSDVLTVYGHREDSDLLLQLAGLLFSRKDFVDQRNWKTHSLYNKKIRLFKISQSNVKYLEDNPNAYHVTDFMKLNHRVLIKFVTAKYLIEDTSIDWSLDTSIVKNVDPEIGQIFSELKTYKSKYLDSTKVNFNNESFNAVKELCEKNNLLDKPILDKLKRVQAWSEKYPLVKYVDIPNEQATNEFKIYMKAKGNIHSLLLQRFKQFKTQKQESNAKQN